MMMRPVRRLLPRIIAPRVVHRRARAMVRLLFMRHAESEENYFIETLATRYPDGFPKKLGES